MEKIFEKILPFPFVLERLENSKWSHYILRGTLFNVCYWIRQGPRNIVDQVIDCGCSSKVNDLFRSNGQKKFPLVKMSAKSKADKDKTETDFVMY